MTESSQYSPQQVLHARHDEALPVAEDDAGAHPSAG